ncbi:MAG: phosphate/phosphite/phosphonate ABC transporter substrate-binding protein [Candidatus Electronema sp. V4]|uniref:phosphate/phosphite/phosphonate ABC transporter substrate-binding protein n=1 Tax=Candidatus Electronema sp. V4 TaxID=3454756 RepID=UPI004055774F
MMLSKKLPSLMSLATLWLCAALSTVPAAAEEYTIGVLAKSGDLKAISQWSAHGEHLSKALGESVSVVPVTFNAMDNTVREKKVDFILANPAIYVDMHDKYGTEAVATMINSINGKSVHQFGGVIFVRKASPIQTLADIKGKKFGFVKRTSFGGLHAGLYTLMTNGINPEKDCAAFEELGTHEKVVRAVEDGIVDAGTVRTDTLERMVEDGKIKMEDFRVIHPGEAKDFPFVHSSKLYPEWPLAALAHVNEGARKKVKEALLAMKPDSEAAVSGKIVGWKDVADYAPVRECLKTIGMSAGE